MFLTITTTGTSERPATDLGFLLHKHPDRVQTYSTTSGTAHVFAAGQRKPGTAYGVA